VDNCLKCLQPLGAGPQRYGLHQDCFSNWFSVKNEATFTSLARKLSASFQDNITPENDSFFHGKFKKYSAILDGRSFILKMRQMEAPEIPEVEYLCNQIGHELGIPVAKFYMIDFEGDKVFVTENFIHHTIPMDLQHIYHFREGTQHNC
jgi:hypothetical protein